MPTTYTIIETARDGSLQPLDGELFHTKPALFKALPYADYDATVIAIDLAECIADGSTPCRDVTEDMVLEAWGALNRTEREDYAERGLFSLASRFVSDEYREAVGASEDTPVCPGEREAA